MRILTGTADADLIADSVARPSAVTIGKFDGLHLGHRAVLRRLREVADAEGLAAAVVTFDRNPLSLLAPEACPPAVVSLAQKLELLEQAGVDTALVLRFDAELAALPPVEFVDRMLVGALNARHVIVGSRFRFGARAAGTVPLLAELGRERGFSVEPLEEIEPAASEAGDAASSAGAGRRASSSWVRELLAAGDVARAAVLLGRPHSIRSTVVHGLKRGRELGWPTANLDPAIEGFVPADGVYAAWAIVDGQRYAAAVSIGDNPTFTGVPAKQVEAYLLDQDLDLYDRTLELQFVERLRGQTAFTGIDPLKAQIAADVERTRELLLAH